MRINTLINKKGLEYIPTKSKGSAMLETFLRGLANQIKVKKKANKGFGMQKALRKG
jgi:hypothetical protein